MLGRQETDRRTGEVEERPELIDPEHASFVVGFPCTRFGCRGTLREDPNVRRPAVACSVCEHVYYHLDVE